jgi:hypothetical protein
MPRYQHEPSNNTGLFVRNARIRVGALSPIKSIDGMCTDRAKHCPILARIAPTYAVQVIAPSSLNTSVYRPGFAVFGGHFMP